MQQVGFCVPAQDSACYFLCAIIGIVLYHITKIVTVYLICKNPKLSDEKVKHLTNMVSKPHDLSFLKDLIKRS